MPNLSSILVAAAIAAVAQLSASSAEQQVLGAAEALSGLAGSASTSSSTLRQSAQTQQTLAAAGSAADTGRSSAEADAAAFYEQEREHGELLSRLTSQRVAMRAEKAADSLVAHSEWHDEELKEAQEAIFIEELLQLTGADDVHTAALLSTEDGEDEELLGELKDDSEGEKKAETGEKEEEQEEEVAAVTKEEEFTEAELLGEGQPLMVEPWLSDNSTIANAFLEVDGMSMSWAEMEKIHGYCEICQRIVQMYQRALPDVCSGLTDTFFITCVKNLESLLKADRAVVYWHSVGCMHLDDGPEIVKPCPAHTICGWVPNIFARRVGVTQAIGQLAPLCPRDINFLPRVPRTLAPGGLPGS